MSPIISRVTSSPRIQSLSLKLAGDWHTLNQLAQVVRDDTGVGRCRYGLLASVLADRKGDFDRFLSYYNEQENEQGLACWQQVST